MNRKRVIGSVAAAVITAGVPATLLAATAGSASAATHHPLTSTTRIVNRLDGGGNGPWAYDSFRRTLTLNYLGKVTAAQIAANPSLATTPYMYNAAIQDKGTFRDIPGAFTPNQGGRYLDKHLRPGQVTGPMSGYGQFGVFYASAKAHNGLVPSVLRGALLNSSYPSSTWPELAFAPGTTFAAGSVNESVYDYTYQAVPFIHYVVKTVNGKHVIVKVTGFKQHWEDSSFNGDGQLVRDGNIVGLNH
jgi:hypothetical protein